MSAVGPKDYHILNYSGWSTYEQIAQRVAEEWNHTWSNLKIHLLFQIFFAFVIQRC